MKKVGAEIGPYFQSRLAELSHHPLVGEVRGVGLIAAIELVEDKATHHRYQSDLKVGIRCRDHAANRGLIMRAVEDSMVLSPPLIISKSQIDDLVDIAADALDDTLRELPS